MNSIGYQENMNFLKLPRRNPIESTHYGEDLINNEIDIYYHKDSLALENSIGLDEYKPIIIVLHGGYWVPKVNKDYYSPLAGALYDKGYTVLLPEYSRILGNPDIYVDDIVNFLNKLPNIIEKKVRKVLVIGHSVGGYLSIIGNLRARVKVDGMILLAPVVNLQYTEENLEIRGEKGGEAVKEFLGQTSKMREDLDPILLEVAKIPTLIIHGKVDSRVHIVTSREYVDYARNNSVQIKLLEIENNGHFELIDPTHINFQILLNEIENFEF